MGDFTEEGAILPNDYFTNFELKRLHLTYYGSVKDMNPDRSKLLLAGIFFFRCFIYGVLLNYTGPLKLGKGAVKKEKLLNICSILYLVGIDHIKLSAPTSTNNQSFLSKDLKVTQKTPYKAFDENEKITKQPILKDTTRDCEIINGFFGKQQMDCVFKDKKKLTDEMKGLFVGWVDKLYDLSHTAWKKQKEQEKREL